MTPEGEVLDREVTELDWDEETAEKGGYETFMLKEIHEQADAVAETIADRTVRDTGVDFGEEFDEALLRDAKRIIIVACGTSYHSGVFARYAIQNWAKVPVGVDIASEYRYSDPLVGPGDVVIGMTQSGETADTLAAMRVAREKGATVIAVTNVMGSQATRDSDATIFTRAGQEVSVAATKTFTCQVAVMLLVALRIAELRGAMEADRLAALVREVKQLPHHISDLVDALDESGVIDRIAGNHFERDFFLYLGRHVGLPVALEGALKLKEISYIATDAYAAGEMKHGPIALLSRRRPSSPSRRTRRCSRRWSRTSRRSAPAAPTSSPSRPRATWTSASTPRRSSACPTPSGSSRPSSPSSRCRCWPTRSPAAAG